VAGYDVSYRYTWVDLAGVFLRAFPRDRSRQRKFVQTLLVMGLQRETASRGVLAAYTSVCLLHHSSFEVSQLF
jgi:hypothetical protein